MATITAATEPEVRRGSIAPDGYERVLAVAAVGLLVAMLAALVRGRAEWATVPAAVWAHLATIAVALVLTPAVLLRPRGDRRHRMLGRVWVVAMASTAVITLAIRQINGGQFSWIHLLSLYVIVQAPLIWWTAARHQVVRHRRMVRGMTTGALLIAGLFTFPFGRLLGHWLFA